MISLTLEDGISHPNLEPVNASFKLADGHGYMLDTNSYQAAGRLNLQHYLWRETFGFNIHPSIKLPDSPRIADLACGTGLWLIDVARDIPTAQLDGLDYDLTRAPHPGWLPSNVQLRHWNMFEDVPPELEGKYDLVHIRLLILVLSSVDIRKPLSNFLKLLKPGGYIQWDDIDCMEMCVKKADSSLDTPALDELNAAHYSNGRHDWILDLPRLLMREGFQSTKLHWYDQKAELLCAFNDVFLMTMGEFAAQLMRTGQQEGAARFRHLIAHSYEEYLRGAVLSQPRVVVVGRRRDSI